MRAYHFIRCWILSQILVVSVATHPALASKIVLIAGPITGHPKEAHEYEKCVVLLKELLETSPNLPGHPQVEIHFHGWPTDPKSLDDADTIVMLGDGGDHREQDHPLYVGDRREQFAKQMKRGCGCVFLHWSVFHPARFHDDTTEWNGAYFDYETGPGANHWYSAIQTWSAEARPMAGHPVTQGVHSYRVPEEFYYRVKTRENDSRLIPLLITRPPGETTDYTVAWAVERTNGGRGFGTTGGHFFTNYWQPDFRRLVLNAIAWTAHLLPDGGVDSLPMERFRVLVVTGANHPAHDWRQVTAALVPVLEQDPRVLVTVTENPEELAQAGFLAPYDLVVWNNVNWERPGLSAAAREQLLAYFHRGGGLSLIHFAASAFHPSIPGTRPGDAWPEWSDKIAARVWEHRPPSPSGHDAYGSFEVHPTGWIHPITTGLTAFSTEDELYFHQVGSVSVEPLVTARSKTTGADEPLAWAYPYDKARVFETLLGHSGASIQSAAALIRRGSVWASGHAPLGFDPPTDGLSKTLWRDGSQWSPKMSQAKAGQAAVTSPEEPTAPASTPKPEASIPPAVLPSGTPKISGREASAQSEADWVDNRWQQTDIGTFLASNLRLPDRVLAKGLTIRVGEHGEGSVAYDLAIGAWAACWTGGFLTIEPGRFGLIGAPSPGGELFPMAPAVPTWLQDNTSFVGLHRSSNRVVLESMVGGTRVLESPWLRPTPFGPIFVRDFWVAPHTRPLRFVVAGPTYSSTRSRSPSMTVKDIPTIWDRSDGTSREFWVSRRIEQQTRLLGVIMDPPAIAGGGVSSLRGLELIDGSYVLTIPANDQPLAFSSMDWVGEPRDLNELVAVAAKRQNSAEAKEPSLLARLELMPSLWKALSTEGQLGATNEWLAVDTLTLPYDNPFHALFFASGIDFGAPGEAFICTIHGDVWRVTGIDASLKELKWQRYATGLFQPLGLKVRDGKVLVLGRDRITRLHDLNQDGEADFYESWTDSMATSTGGHDYVTCLEADAVGNLYYTDPRGVHRVSPDGKTQVTLATGWRNPNGMGVRGDGLVTVAPQQGEWTPSSQISEVKIGAYYGYPGPKVTADQPLGYRSPLCWIPHSVDNSSGSQVWLPDGVWGPLGGHMLHLKWGRCGMMAVLRDEVGDTSQGAVFNLPVKFLSGPNRASFNPRDGALYVAGSTGWQTSALRDGSLQRVRWLGGKNLMPTGWHARTNGLEITFNHSLTRETAQDVGSYALQQWNYRYAAQYGSKDWSVSNPEKEGHDEVVVKAARLSSDGKSVFLETDPLQPVMQMVLKWNLGGEDGTTSHQDLWLTLNRLDKEVPQTQ